MSGPTLRTKALVRIAEFVANLPSGERIVGQPRSELAARFRVAHGRGASIQDLADAAGLTYSTARRVLIESGAEMRQRGLPPGYRRANPIMTKQRRAVLRALLDGGDLYLTQLSDRTGICLVTVHRMVAPLRNAGWIGDRKHPGTENGLIRRYVYLTELGTDIAKKIQAEAQ